MVEQTDSHPIKTITLAKQDMVQKYSYQLDVVLGILNSPEALVTDESTVGDFIRTDEPDIDKARLVDLADTFNCDVGMTTPLWKLAAAICWEDSVYGDLEKD